MSVNGIVKRTKPRYDIKWDALLEPALGYWEPLSPASALPTPLTEFSSTKRILTKFCRKAKGKCFSINKCYWHTCLIFSLGICYMYTLYKRWDCALVLL